jgi:hypothetical protein
MTKRKGVNASSQLEMRNPCEQGTKHYLQFKPRKRYRIGTFLWNQGHVRRGRGQSQLGLPLISSSVGTSVASTTGLMMEG